MMESLLSLIDRVLGIDKPEAYRPPPPIRLNKDKGNNVRPIDMKEIADFYREANADMRALRDWEFKIVTLYIQVSAFFFAGNMALFASQSTNIGEARFWIGCVSITFLIAFWLHVHARIAHDNKSYGFNMGHRQYIERLWFGAAYPKPPQHLRSTPAPWWKRVWRAPMESASAGERKATGPGYRRVQALVALSAIASSTAIAVGVAWLAPSAYKLFCL